MTVNRSLRRTCTLGLAAASLCTSFLVAGIPAAAAAHVYDGPDVASYQHPSGHAINWAKVKKAGKDFAIVKATEGTGYTNSYFASDYAGARAAGLVHGSYHFARPAQPIVSTAQAQAQYFASKLGSVTTTKTLPPALDLEVTGGLSRPQLVTWAQTFLLELRTLTHRTPMLYTFPAFWSDDLGDPAAFARFPLWMAHFGTSQAPDADLWQYTDDAKVSGIAGSVDVSKYVGKGAESWSSLSNGTVAVPWAVTAPAPPLSVAGHAKGSQVSVSWLPSDAGNSRITSYTVTASPGGQTVKVGGSKTSAVFTGLGHTSHTFTVRARNATGTSSASAASAPVTVAIPTTMSATSSAAAVSYGSSVAIIGSLTRSATGAPLVNHRVLVYHRAHKGGHWTKVAEKVTDSNGTVTATLHPRHTVDAELVFAGGKGLARSQAYRTVVVRPVVAAALSATEVPSGRKVSLTGRVTPAVTHQVVEREVYVSGAWRRLDRTKTTSHGAFRFTFTPTAVGRDAYRVMSLVADGRGHGLSPHLHLTVDQAD